MRLISALIGCSLLLGMAACTQTSTSQDYTDFVNPFIGTGGHGHTYPGAVVPNGMIQPSPDTRIYQWDACSGYYYNDSTINGFSHTHLSGTGCLLLANRIIRLWVRKASRWLMHPLFHIRMKWLNRGIIL